MIHFSRFGYHTACGKHLDESHYLTTDPKRVTCSSCLRTRLVKAVRRSGQWR